MYNDLEQYIILMHTYCLYWSWVDRQTSAIGNSFMGKDNMYSNHLSAGLSSTCTYLIWQEIAQIAVSGARLFYQGLPKQRLILPIDQQHLAIWELKRREGGRTCFWGGWDRNETPQESSNMDRASYFSPFSHCWLTFTYLIYTSAIYACMEGQLHTSKSLVATQNALDNTHRGWAVRWRLWCWFIVMTRNILETPSGWMCVMCVHSSHCLVTLQLFIKLQKSPFSTSAHKCCVYLIHGRLLNTHIPAFYKTKHNLLCTCRVWDSIGPGPPSPLGVCVCVRERERERKREDLFEAKAIPPFTGGNINIPWQREQLLQ